MNVMPPSVDINRCYLFVACCLPAAAAAAIIDDDDRAPY